MVLRSRDDEERDGGEGWSNLVETQTWGRGAQ